MLLALDTCFGACSVALYDGRVIASRHEDMERGHAEVLGPMVQAVLTQAGVEARALGRIAVTIGPGTFTGLRIGLAYAKGMALALKIPLIGLDSLTATAAPHFGVQDRIAVVQVAGGTGQFYFTAFEGHSGAPCVPLRLARVADVTEQLGAARWHLVGTGAAQFAGHDELKPALPDAASFAAYASSLPESKAPVQPLYLRAPDAKPSLEAKNCVRLAVTQDIPAMADIHAKCFPPGWSIDSLTSSLSIPGAGAIVVELAGTIYGFAQYQRSADQAEINTLCVSPPHRQQGFASDLLTALIDLLKQQGTARIFLEVSENNAAALGLYQRFGFVRQGLRKHYYADGSNAVLMQRVLFP